MTLKPIIESSEEPSQPLFSKFDSFEGYEYDDEVDSYQRAYGTEQEPQSNTLIKHKYQQEQQQPFKIERQSTACQLPYNDSKNLTF